MKSLLALFVLFSFLPLQTNAGSTTSRGIASESTARAEESKWLETIAVYCQNTQGRPCDLAYENLREGRFMSAILHTCGSAGDSELTCYDSFAKLDANLGALLEAGCVPELPSDQALKCKKRLIVFESLKQFAAEKLAK